MKRLEEKESVNVAVHVVFNFCFPLLYTHYHTQKRELKIEPHHIFMVICLSILLHLLTFIIFFFFTLADRVTENLKDLTSQVGITLFLSSNLLMFLLTYLSLL